MIPVSSFPHSITAEFLSFISHQTDSVQICLQSESSHDRDLSVITDAVQ